MSVEREKERRLKVSVNNGQVNCLDQNFQLHYYCVNSPNYK